MTIARSTAPLVRSVRKPLALCAALLLAGLTGCASAPPPAVSAAPEAEPREELPAAIQAFLDEPSGSALRLATSPWGPDITLRAQAPYHAASGRSCRGLTIQSDGAQRPGLACRLGEGPWQKVRVLYDSGRPLLATDGGRSGPGGAR